MIDEQDRTHLRRCVELAAEALDAGFGSRLVSKDGRTLVSAGKLSESSEQELGRHERLTQRILKAVVAL